MDMPDMTVAAKVKAPEFDPLGTMGKLQTVQSGMLNNQLLGLQVGGKQALGQIIGQNTDPGTGETDWGKVSAAASQDPRAAILLPEIQKATLDRQLTQVQLQREQLGLSGDQWGKVGASAIELLGRKGADGQPVKLTREDVSKAMAQDLIGSGMFHDENSVKRLTGFLTSLPNDPAGIAQALKGIAIMSSPTPDRVALINGSQETVNTGSQQVQQQRSALTGEVTPNAVFDNTRGPDAKAGLVQKWNPQTHQMDLVPSGEVVGDMAPGAVPGQPSTGAKPIQPVAAAPALGETATAEAGVQQAQALQQRAAIVPTRKAALKNMVDSLDSFTPGPKADLTYQVKALATQFGKPSPSVAKGVAAQEEFNKLAAQIALDQWGSLGGSGSNEQLATAMKANPGATLSKMGIKNVAALLQGNEDAIGAQFSAWKKYSATHGPGSYGDFLEGWNRYYDPRVYQAQHMDAGSRKAMVAKMSPAERKTFDRDQSIAQQAGWLGQ